MPDTKSQDALAPELVAVAGSDRFVFNVHASSANIPSSVFWTNGASTPLTQFSENDLRAFAEWVRREIMKAHGYDPNNEVRGG